MEASSNV